MVDLATKSLLHDKLRFLITVSGVAFAVTLDTRVLLVKIALLEPTPLKLGQRVEIRIENGGQP